MVADVPKALATQKEAELPEPKRTVHLTRRRKTAICPVDTS